MSVLTFEILSIELTQALSEQGSTPPKTAVRCTLGRNKVMVLAEYPLENARRVEPSTIQILDWIEQWLRHQFDTTGLPEEAADLANNGSEVHVQLFLKHLAESKPFTMRSFIWKVDDGFDDLFGLPFGIDHSASQVGLYSPAVSALQESAHYEKPVSYGAENASAESSVENSSKVTATEPGRSQTATSAEDSFANTSVQIEERQRLLEAERFDSVISGLSDAYFPDDERVPLELDDEHLQLEMEPDIDIDDRFDVENGFGLGNGLDLEEELGYYADASLRADLAVGLSIDELLVASSSELLLPGEHPERDADEFNLPTLDPPEASARDIQPIDVDFFNLDGDSALQTCSSEDPSEDFGDLLADLDPSLDDGSNAVENSGSSENNFGLSGFEAEPNGFEAQFEAQLDSKPEGAEDATVTSSIFDFTDEESALGFEPESFEPESFEPESFDSESAEPESFEPESFEPENAEMAEPGLDDVEANEPAESEAIDLEPIEFDEDSAAYEDEAPEAYEDEAPEAYEDDPAYYLEGEAADDELPEEVASVDETEVQRQREQWQQQSRTNPWVFAGALGFVFIGVLGFLFTRPCTFGSCDRLQTAQENSAEALSTLRSDSSLDAVTDAKQQLKRSTGLLAPIPIWSRYYPQAQADLPVYKAEIKSLDYVTEAQKTAYQAAVDSQNPPHPTSKWQTIAKGWGAAADLLDKVPADSPVRELTERKLVEYRANRATILARIDAESKAEKSLRQAQQAASLGSKQVESAGSMASWETALASWETAVDSLSGIPKGTYAYGEAQKLLPEYLKKLDQVRDRTEQERSASRTLIEAKQLATGAQKAEAEEQWSASVQGWKTATSQLQSIRQGTLAHADAQALQKTYASSLTKAENNLQVALRFQPIEPNFFAACGVTGSQKCTYSLKGGNVRLDLFQGYDAVIDQSITPPDQRAIDPAVPQLVGQSNQLLQDITLLSAQAELPIELYDAKGEFLAAYRPELKGFTRQELKQRGATADL